MRFILKILIVLTISSLPTSTIVACNNSPINPDPKSETITISFQEIIHFDILSSFEKEDPTSSTFILMKNMGINPSNNIPKNLFCDNYDTSDKQGCFFFVGDNNVWNQISNVYGFPSEPTKDKSVDQQINEMINTVAIKNVIMTFFNQHINQVWSYKLINFSAEKK